MGDPLAAAAQSLRTAQQMDCHCDAFEQAWLSGQQPSLESAVVAPGIAPPDELLRELLPIDIYHRLQRGQTPKATEYIERFPDSDASYIHSLVEKLVAHHAHNLTTSVPDRVAERPTGDHPFTQGQAGHDPDIAQRRWLLPGFEILGILGHGGMGVVYQARQTTLGRLVAIKMISAGDLAAAADIARFRREAATIAQLNDPHIVQLFEIGFHGARPYLVMEYVPGLPLSEVIRQTLPPPKAAAQLVAVLARTMHEVHQRGIVHRDLKPANILLAGQASIKTGEASAWWASLKPKITDFGLAKTTAQSCDLTISGGVLGTPSYMAPEQARGDEQITPAADTYGLGAVLYELLTGRPPFKSFQVATTLRQVAEQEPVSPRQLHPQIPLDLNTICLKCLEKSPPSRYRDALELSEDLERFLRHEPIRARRVSPQMRLLRWCQRRPATAAAAMLALVASISLVLVAVFYSSAMTQSRSAIALRQEQLKTTQALQEVSTLRSKAEELSASLAINQGQVLCETDNAARGLLWLTRGLQLVPADRPALAIATRKNIAAWQRQVHALRHVQPLARDSSAMAMNGAGDQLAIVGYDRHLRLFDTRRGEPVGEPCPLGHVGTAVTYSDDGRWVACGGLNGTISLWNASTRNIQRSWVAHAEQIYALKFAASDGHLISAGRDSVAKVWKTEDGSPALQPLVHSGAVLGLAVSTDGNQLLTGSLDGTLRRWNLTTGQLIKDPIQHSSGVLCAAISHDGRSYALGRMDGTTQLFDFSTDIPRGKAMEHRARVRSVAFSPDDRRVLTSSRDSTARLWDAVSNRPVGAPLDHRDELCSALMTPDGKTIATTAEDRTLRFWRVANTDEPAVQWPREDRTDATSKPLDPAWKSRHFFGMRWRHQDAQTIGFSPSGRLAYGIAEGGLDLGKARAIQLYDSANGQKLGKPLALEGVLIDIAFSPDESRLVTVSSSGRAQLWNVASGQPEAARQLATRGVIAAAFHPDNQQFATVGREGIEFWNCSDAARAQATIPAHGDPQFVLFDPTGTRLALVHSPGDADLFHAQTGKLTASLANEAPGGVSCAAFSNDGSSLLISDWNGSVRVWRTDVPGSRNVLLEHHEPVWAAQFSPDGHTVAVATSAGNIYLWDAHSGQAVTAPFQPREYIDDLAFSPDGRTLLLGSSENTLRLVDVFTGRPLGPAWMCAAPVQHVHFLRGGDFYVSGDQTIKMRLHKSPPAQAGAIEDIRAGLEALSGLRLGDDGVIRCLDADEWNATRQRASTTQP